MGTSPARRHRVAGTRERRTTGQEVTIAASGGAPDQPPESMAPTKRPSLGLDHVLSITAIAISTLVALAVLVLTLMADDVDRRRQAVDEGTQTDAAFVEACLAYETFVIDQYRAGLTDDQIQELVPVGLLVLQTGVYQNPQACPAVDEIVTVLETPRDPGQGPLSQD